MLVITRLVSIPLRIAEIISGTVVVGIVGYYLNHLGYIDAWDQARWIYTITLASLSVLLALLWLIPFSSGFFSWPADIIISLAWFASFGILIDELHKIDSCSGAWEWSSIGISSWCGRWHAAEAFSFISAALWLVSAILGIWFTFRVRGTTGPRGRSAV